MAVENIISIGQEAASCQALALAETVSFRGRDLARSCSQRKDNTVVQNPNFTIRAQLGSEDTGNNGAKS